MAERIQLPCDNQGVCLICKTTPSANQTLTCNTCVTPWHIACLAIAAQSASSNVWEYPDCTDLLPAGAPAAGEKSELVAAIQAIEADASLTDKQKARKRQDLLSGKATKEKEDEEGRNEVVDMINVNFKCYVCIQLLQRPVTIIPSSKQTVLVEIDGNTHSIIILEMRYCKWEFLNVSISSGLTAKV